MTQKLSADDVVNFYDLHRYRPSARMLTFPGRPEPLTGDRKVRRATRPEFVVKGNPGMRTDDDEQGMRRARRADDEDVQANDDTEQMVRCGKCAKALGDDEQLLNGTGWRCSRCHEVTSYADDDQELDEDDLDDSQVELEGYDEDDLYKGPMARFPRQPNRSDGATTQGERASRRHAGPDSARRGMSPGRDPQDVAHSYQQMGYDGPPGRGQMAPVRGSERYMTATEKRLAQRLSAVEAAVSGSNVRLMIDMPPAGSVLGEDVVGMARRYARERGLSWRDPAQRMLAIEAVGGSDPNGLATPVDTGYAILATHSRDLELVEPLTDGEWVDAAKRLAQRRGWDYADPDVRLRAFQAVAGR